MTEMISRFAVTALAIVALSLEGRAQEKEKPAPVRIRVVLHDPVRPVAELFYLDSEEKIARVEFRPQDFSDAFLTLPVDGALVLYDKAAVDPANPGASVAAKVSLPQGLKQAACVILPGPADGSPAYRMVLIEDSEAAFPPGESRVLSLIKTDTAIQAGEHRVPVRPGKVNRVPPVRKVDAFNMAQTNFYYQHAGSWIAFAERQLQYVDACRRLFIVHATPGALQPTVTTIVDTNPRVPLR